MERWSNEPLPPAPRIAVIANDAIGKIDVFATRAYVALARSVDKTVPDKLRAGKIKGRSFRLRWL